MATRSSLSTIAAGGMLLFFFGSVYASEQWRVCAAEGAAGLCDFIGDNSIQKAVNIAKDGDSIVLAPGLYTPRSTQDIPLNELLIRGYVVVSGKDLSIYGEDGAIISGVNGAPSCALLIHNSTVNISNLKIQNFKYDIEEDDIYDGHGVFIINSKVRIDSIKFSYIQKMALSSHGNSFVEATRLQILDSHIGVWTNDNSRVSIRDSRLSRNDSAGIAAYQHSRVKMENSLLEYSEDDGVYAADHAELTILTSTIINNKPIGIHADKDSKISIDTSYVADNETNYSSAMAGKGVVSIGTDMRLHTSDTL